MKIGHWRLAEGMGGWYCDDKPALTADASTDYYLVQGEPRTPGFRAVREVGECLSVMFEVRPGQWAVGDCTCVTYSGIAGRDPVFRSTDGLPIVAEVLSTVLIDFEFHSFRKADSHIAALRREGQRLHTAIRYGLSQALLDFVALHTNKTKAEIVSQEFGFSLSDCRPAIGIQSGEDRYNAVDKAIYRRVGAFPHGLIKHMEKDLGSDGGKLIAYARWIRKRIDEHKVEPEYKPRIHFDLYGTLGLLFENDPGRIAGYLSRIADATAPYPVQAESPVECSSQNEQIAVLAALR